jgi:hypothetical protein
MFKGLISAALAYADRRVADDRSGDRAKDVAKDVAKVAK